jgi:hypothetical protein
VPDAGCQSTSAGNFQKTRFSSKAGPGILHKGGENHNRSEAEMDELEFSNPESNERGCTRIDEIIAGMPRSVLSAVSIFLSRIWAICCRNRNSNHLRLKNPHLVRLPKVISETSSDLCRQVLVRSSRFIVLFTKTS